MSLVKITDVRCDLCGERHHATREMVANSWGITKGNGAAAVRREVKELGWTRRQTRRRVWIDLCPVCSSVQHIGPVWFEQREAS